MGWKLGLGSSAGLLCTSLCWHKSLLYKNYIIGNQSWWVKCCAGKAGSSFWQSNTEWLIFSFKRLKQHLKVFFICLNSTARCSGVGWFQYKECISESGFVYGHMTDKTPDSLDCSNVIVRESSGAPTKFKQPPRPNTFWPSSNVSTCRNSACPWKIKRWTCVSHIEAKRGFSRKRNAWRSDMKVIVCMWMTVGTVLHWVVKLHLNAVVINC